VGIVTPVPDEHEHSLEAGFEREKKLTEEARREGLVIVPRMHPGFRVWSCLGCGKEWSLPKDVPYPMLTCDCGSVDFQLKAVLDREVADIGKAVEGVLKKVERDLTAATSDILRRLTRR